MGMGSLQRAGTPLVRTSERKLCHTQGALLDHIPSRGCSRSSLQDAQRKPRPLGRPGFKEGRTRFPGGWGSMRSRHIVTLRQSPECCLNWSRKLYPILQLALCQAAPSSIANCDLLERAIACARPIWQQPGARHVGPSSVFGGRSFSDLRVHGASPGLAGVAAPTCAIASDRRDQSS